jgi:hypothetical protein
MGTEDRSVRNAQAQWYEGCIREEHRGVGQMSVVKPCLRDTVCDLVFLAVRTGGP